MIFPVNLARGTGMFRLKTFHKPIQEVFICPSVRKVVKHWYLCSHRLLEELLDKFINQFRASSCGSKHLTKEPFVFIMFKFILHLRQCIRIQLLDRHMPDFQFFRS